MKYVFKAKNAFWILKSRAEKKIRGGGEKELWGMGRENFV
jgi:hypothetical protein